MWHSNGSSQNAFHGCWSLNLGLKMVPPHLPSQGLILFFVRFFMILTWDIPHFWTNPFIFLVFLGSHHSPFFGSQFLGHGQCSNPLPNMVLYCWCHFVPMIGPALRRTSKPRDETRRAWVESVWSMLARAGFFILNQPKHGDSTSKNIKNGHVIVDISDVYSLSWFSIVEVYDS